MSGAIPLLPLHAFLTFTEITLCLPSLVSSPKDSWKWLKYSDTVTSSNQEVDARKCVINCVLGLCVRKLLLSLYYYFNLQKKGGMNKKENSAAFKRNKFKYQQQKECIFIFIPCIFIVYYLLFVPTNAHVYILNHITNTATCFGASAPSSGSLYNFLLKLYYLLTYLLHGAESFLRS